MLTKRKKTSLLPKTRRASVLILVVVLLVLLALMGTAYVVTTRVDSTATLTGNGGALTLIGQSNGAYDPSVLNTANSDLTTLVQTRLLDDIFANLTNVNAPTNFRQTMPSYTNYTSYGSAANNGWLISQAGGQVMPFLAAAAPVPLLTTTTPPSAPANLSSSFAGTTPGWPAISGYLAYPTPWATMDFEDPRGGAAVPSPTAPPPGSPATGTKYSVNGTPALLQNAQPASVNIGYLANYLGANPAWRVFPALKLSNGNTFLAADASGCGIGDSGLFPITDTSGNRRMDSNGVQYYGAMKIIDNNALINATTAWCRNGDVPATIPGTFAGLTLPNFGLFRSNIGLYEMFQGLGWADNEMTAVNTLRFGANLSGQTPTPNSLPAPWGRTDFTYITAGDAMEMGLARRTGNPGPSAAASTFSPFSSGGQTELAYHVGLSNPNGSLTDVDSRLANSTYSYARNYVNTLTPADPYKPYLNYKFYPADLAQGPTASSNFYGWFQNHYDQEANTTVNNDPLGNYRSLRGYLTTYGAESNYVPAHDMSGLVAAVKTTTPATAPDLMPDFAKMTPAKPAIPRASVNTASFGELWRAYWNVMVEDVATGPVNPKGGTSAMFRNPIRLPSAATLTGPDMTLLRAALAAANTETLRAPATSNNVTEHTIALSGGRTAYVFGTRKQVYLTECFAYVAPAATSNYLAIELYNPYSVAINIKGWQLAALSRSTMTLTAIGTPAKTLDALIGSTTIAANTRIVLEDATTTRPPGVVPQGTIVSYTGLAAAAIGKELVLLRPPADGGAIATLNQAAPIDSINLSSIPATATPAQSYDYARPTDTATTPWQWVYPGGTGTGIQNPPIANPNSMLGQNKLLASATITPMTVPVCLAGWPSPNPISGITGNKFPFGGFARNADIMQVTYFGGYQIPGVECNSVTQDCVFANDPGYTPAGAQPAQQIGRFCSLTSLAGATAGAAVATDNYSWAERLMDYVTAIQNPNDDYFPAVPNPNANTSALNSANFPQYNPATPAVAVPNGPITATAQANQGNEDGVPIQGRININTAPWQVLNMLPLVVDPATGTIDTPAVAQANASLAYAIVQYRSQHGPFQTVFDLNKVPGFQYATNASWPAPSAKQSVALGDITMADTSASGFPNLGSPPIVTPLADFRPSYYQLTRLSNLITTRSDTFTCYLLIQGWKNVGTTQPQLVVEQRTAFVIDRNGVNNTNNTTSALNVTSIPNQ